MTELEVCVLREGALKNKPGVRGVFAPATITLIKEEFNTLVDLGGPYDSPEDLKTWVSNHGLKLENIDYIVITHNHPDHTELKRAIIPKSGLGIPIFASDSRYQINASWKNSRHMYDGPIDDGESLYDGVTIIKTPGHENSMDQSVLIETEGGLVAIVGDLFLNEDEFRNPDKFLWPPDNKELALKSRKRIIEMNPYKIIPGHGPEFTV